MNLASTLSDCICNADDLVRSARTAMPPSLDPATGPAGMAVFERYRAAMTAGAVEGMPIPWGPQHGPVPGSFLPGEKDPGPGEFADDTIEIRVPCQAQYVDITGNDLLVTGLALAMAPIALLHRMMSGLLGGTGEDFSGLPKSVFGTGDRGGLMGAIIGDNSTPEDKATLPGTLGVSMGVAHNLFGGWLGNFDAHEAGGLWHNLKTGNAPSNAVESALHTVGQGLGVLAYHLNLDGVFNPIVDALAAAPEPAGGGAVKAGYGFAAGWRQGTRQPGPDVVYRVPLRPRAHP